MLKMLIVVEFMKAGDLLDHLTSLTPRLEKHSIIRIIILPFDVVIKKYPPTSLPSC